ncbi:CPBP family intramembrane metalloprotease [Candidatus Micrarchaeota archaeon]|nr:CPBP family intramembrane metalloprotease [Candidatus Micrarchaeota archaeon]
MDAKRVFLAVFLLSVISFFILLAVARDTFYYEAPVHLAIFSLALFFLWKKDLGTTLRFLGVPGDLKRNILFTIGGFIGLMAALIATTALLSALGINDGEKVTGIVKGLPIYILVFAVIAAPFSEELFFRAFLMQFFENVFTFLRLPMLRGAAVFFSAVAFSLPHFSYGSVTEIIGAFAIGLVLALVYKYSKSVLPCIAIHMIYNLIAITVMLLYQ